MEQFLVAGKQVSVYPSRLPGRPVIYLNTFSDEGERLYTALQSAGCPDFTLAAVSGLDWDRDMSPWESPPAFKSGAPFTGGADDYLELMTREIVPRTEELHPGTVQWRGLAGYSLAGLFAVYSLYKTELFSRVACMSGSLWFPGFGEYVFSHPMKAKPDRLYFSLGDREAKTRNPYLCSVQKNTEEIAAFYRNKGIDTTYRLNPGNHQRDVTERTAAGVLWLVNEMG